MKPSKKIIMFTFSLTFVLLFLILSSKTYALGIVPAQKEITLNELSYVYDIRIVNTEDREVVIEMSFEGDMNQHISLSEKNFVIKPNEHKDIQVLINFNSLEDISGGEHVTRILAREMGTVDTNLIAKVGVASKLIIYKSEEGVVLVPTIHASNFIKNQQNKFLLEIKNKGLKDANNVVSVLDVYSNTNSKVWSTTGAPVNIKSKETESVEFTWIPQLENGNYYVQASVLYGDSIQTTTDTFSIGSPKINVDSITSADFKINKINALNIFLSSEWGEPINNVNTKLELANAEKTFFETRLAPVNFESLGKEVVTGYLDTTKVEPGRYKMLITMEYLGKSQLDVFETVITTDSIKIISTSGNVVSEYGNSNDTKESSDGLSTIFLILIIVVVLNIVVITYLIKSKKNKE